LTISGALSHAISGLRAAGRGAEVVSSNISNALTPGYGRRVLELSSSATGTVQIGGITRIVDASLASDKRLAEAEHANAKGSADFLARVEQLLGTPDNPASLAGRMSSFQSALITAASRPDATERLSAAVADAQGLVTSLRSASAGIQEARGIADRTIALHVDQMNTALSQVVALNSQITATQVQGGDVSALQDARQRVVETIAILAPVREVPRDNGQIALYTVGGAVLVDGTAAKIGFERSNVVTPYMALSTNTLSAVTINGIPVQSGSENGVLRGGAIGSQFAIRDELGVAAQTQIDAIARDLVSRFQDPAVDPSLAAGDPGLFTDDGAAFNPVDERGLASRLALNAAVDPAQGGDVWRIRDGMNAATPGAAGNASVLQSFEAVLNAPRLPASGGFGGGVYSVIDLVATVTSGIAGQRMIAEQELSYAGTRLTELTERQLADGVDTDDEIQRLLMIEKSYAANAKVIQAVDEMMQTILRL
jgi:flagellar hook-associated protein 1 FlgK